MIYPAPWAPGFFHNPAIAMIRMLGQFLLLLCSVLLTAAPPPALPVVRVAAPEGMDATVQVGELVLREAYRRIGYEMQLEKLPSLRSLAVVDAGKYDAELGRIAGMEQQYSNLRVVPTSPLSLTVAALTLKPEIVVRDWEDLRGWRVAAQRGVKVVEARTAGMDVSFATTPDAMVRMLLAGRVDVVLGSPISMPAVLAGMRQRGELAADTRLLEREFYSMPVYHYVHTRNTHLIVPLEQALLAMRKDGFIDRALQQVTAQQVDNALGKHKP